MISFRDNLTNEVMKQVRDNNLRARIDEILSIVDCKIFYNVEVTRNIETFKQFMRYSSKDINEGDRVVGFFDVLYKVYSGDISVKGREITIEGDFVFVIKRVDKIVKDLGKKTTNTIGIYIKDRRLEELCGL